MDEEFKAEAEQENTKLLDQTRFESQRQLVVAKNKEPEIKFQLNQIVSLPLPAEEFNDNSAIQLIEKENEVPEYTSDLS